MVYWILDLRLVLGDRVNYQQAAMCKYLGKIPKLYYITSLHYYNLYNLYIFTVNNRKLWNIPKSIFHLSVRPVVRSSKSFVRKERGTVSKERGWGHPPLKGVIQAPDLHLTGSQWASDHDHEWNNDNHDDNQIHGGCQHHDDSNDEDLSLTTIEIRCVFKKVFVDIFKERFE